MRQTSTEVSASVLGNLFYYDGRTQKPKAENEKEKVGAKDALDFIKPLFEKILGMFGGDRPAIPGAE